MFSRQPQLAFSAQQKLCCFHRIHPFTTCDQTTNSCTNAMSTSLLAFGAVTKKLEFVRTRKHYNMYGCCAHCNNSRAVNVTSSKLCAVQNERVQNIERTEKTFFLQGWFRSKKKLHECKPVICRCSFFDCEQEPSESHHVSKCHHFL